MESSLDALAGQFAAYLSGKLPGTPDVAVASIVRIGGGASRETYRVRVQYDAEGTPRDRGLILRRDPVGSLIDTDRDIEFRAYSAFHGTTVPVPRPLFLEMDGGVLERPFFVMEEVEGCRAPSPFRVDEFGDQRPAVARQFWSILGDIHRHDPTALGLTEAMKRPALDRCWDTELTHWERVIDEDELEPQPIVRGAIRWLRRHPPPPAKRLSVVHGDYRTGNFLLDESGTIRAILDWEMCHLGDAHEDLAWALDPLWAFRDLSRPAGLSTKAEALALWEEASGMNVDRAALRWWEVFAMVKALAIWISSSKEYVAGKNHDPVLGFSGWYCTAKHNVFLSERMRELAAEERRA
jgi:aminoglycoside phosphotransferase (APT) family kinase protein